MTDDQSAADQAFNKAARVLAYGLSQKLGIARSFSRALEAYLANAPRAWAYESKDGLMFRVTHDKEAADELSRRLGGKTFLAALVELTEEEAGK